MNAKNYILYIYIDPNYPELNDYYLSASKEHNIRIIEDQNADSGFDLANPKSITLPDIHFKSHLIDYKIKCKMVNKSGDGCGFYLYPRSSLSKTPLMLSNSIGIIDAGYRGYIKGAFRNLSGGEYTIGNQKCLLQICAPTLEPFQVVIVGNELDLGTTKRGSGGFGSTDLLIA